MTWTKAQHRIYMKEYMRSWRKNNREKDLESHRKSTLKWKKTHPKERREEHKLFNKRHPERKKAWSAARSVDILNVCENCGSQIDIQKHHPDYSKPKEVHPLCRRCNVNAKRILRILCSL